MMAELDEDVFQDWFEHFWRQKERFEQERAEAEEQRERDKQGNPLTPNRAPTMGTPPAPKGKKKREAAPIIDSRKKVK